MQECSHFAAAGRADVGTFEILQGILRLLTTSRGSSLAAISRRYLLFLYQNKMESQFVTVVGFFLEVLNFFFKFLLKILFSSKL